jgi:hypothetical protein
LSPHEAIIDRLQSFQGGSRQLGLSLGESSDQDDAFAIGDRSNRVDDGGRRPPPQRILEKSPRFRPSQTTKGAIGRRPHIWLGIGEQIDQADNDLRLSESGPRAIARSWGSS